MSRKIAAVIPHYRAPVRLARCVAALQSQEGLFVEIHVRDNSVDNILFTRAINEGLRRFCYRDVYDHVLILNQDAYLRPGCLRHLLEVLRGDPSIGIVCPVQVSADDRITWCGSLDAYPWGVHAAPRREIDPRPFPTFWANGAAMLVRTAMVREIGLLDENMHFICSDSDYSFTARARGWNVRVVPAALVEHELEASSGQSSDLQIAQVKLQDQLYFAQKWLSGELYRSMAFEGKKLTPEFLLREMQETRAKLAQVQRLIELAAAGANRPAS